MKVCILTYRLHSNFGFLMQAYALQQVLRTLGHDPYTVDIRVKPLSTYDKIKQIIKYVLLHISRMIGYSSLPWITMKEQAYIDQHTWKFIKEHLQLTPPINSIKDLKREIGNQYDYYLVGSDQVWRKEYCPDIPSYFFDFVADAKRRASYAASFGVSTPEYPPQMIAKCRELLAKFSAVSVREADAVRICHEMFGVSAVHVLDPTLLLTKSDYMKLINPKDEFQLPSSTFILAYILDNTSTKKQFIEHTSKQRKSSVFYIKPQNLCDVGKKRIEECIYPSISTWLRAFEKADFIITDSFHGTVFSIIFQKQFIVLDNPQRGSSRMKSLLNDFSLENRLLSPNGRNDLIFEQIDYGNVNTILSEKQNKSVDFLKRVLNEK